MALTLAKPMVWPEEDQLTFNVIVDGSQKSGITLNSTGRVTKLVGSGYAQPAGLNRGDRIIRVNDITGSKGGVALDGSVAAAKLRTMLSTASGMLQISVARPRRPDSYLTDICAAYGLELERAHEAVRVVGVRQSSVAQSSGLRPGDEMVSIMNRSIDGSLARAHQLLDGPGYGDIPIIVWRRDMPESSSTWMRTTSLASHSPSAVRPRTTSPLRMLLSRSPSPHKSGAAMSAGMQEGASPGKAEGDAPSRAAAIQGTPPRAQLQYYEQSAEDRSRSPNRRARVGDIAIDGARRMKTSFLAALGTTATSPQKSREVSQSKQIYSEQAHQVRRKKWTIHELQRKAKVSEGVSSTGLPTATRNSIAEAATVGCWSGVETEMKRTRGEEESFAQRFASWNLGDKFLDQLRQDLTKSPDTSELIQYQEPTGSHDSMMAIEDYSQRQATSALSAILTHLQVNTVPKSEYVQRHLRSALQGCWSTASLSTELMKLTVDAFEDGGADQENDIIVVAGSLCQDFMVVTAGEYSTFLEMGGKMIELASYGVGSCFNEAALLQWDIDVPMVPSRVTMRCVSQVGRRYVLPSARFAVIRQRADLLQDKEDLRKVLSRVRCLKKLSSMDLESLALMIERLPSQTTQSTDTATTCNDGPSNELRFISNKGLNHHFSRSKCASRSYLIKAGSIQLVTKRSKEPHSRVGKTTLTGVSLKFAASEILSAEAISSANSNEDWYSIELVSAYVTLIPLKLPAWEPWLEPLRREVEIVYLRKLLLAVDPFKCLELADVHHLLRVSSRRTYASGTVISRQGERSELALFIVCEGVASATQMEDGFHVDIGMFTIGDHFGAASLVDNRPDAIRSVTVSAKTDLRVLALNRDSFGDKLPLVLERLRRELDHRRWLLQFRNKVRMSELQKGPLIGKGTYGRVRLAIDPTYGNQAYAVKDMRKDQVCDVFVTQHDAHATSVPTYATAPRSCLNREVILFSGRWSMSACYSLASITLLCSNSWQHMRVKTICTSCLSSFRAASFCPSSTVVGVYLYA